jgi:ABC-type polysaccharide/polyol phosphate export permease
MKYHRVNQSFINKWKYKLFQLWHNLFFMITDEFKAKYEQKFIHVYWYIHANLYITCIYTYTFTHMYIYFKYLNRHVHTCINIIVCMIISLHLNTHTYSHTWLHHMYAHIICKSSNLFYCHKVFSSIFMLLKNILIFISLSFPQVNKKNVCILNLIYTLENRNPYILRYSI